MTIATDQAVHSNVYITEVLTTDVNALIFNDMKQFSKNVALLKDDTRIDSRVKISDCKVKNAMKLSDNEGEDMTEHIVGTHMDDLTQIYNGHVVIKGTTNINNIFVFDTPKNLESQGSRDDSLFNEALSTDQSEPTGIIIDGINLVWRNINHLYWSKTLSQVRFMTPILFAKTFKIVFFSRILIVLSSPNLSQVHKPTLIIWIQFRQRNISHWINPA